MKEKFKTAGEFRKEIYKLLELVCGRTLKEDEHEALSKILKDYVRAHAPTFPINPGPIEHLFICGKCGGKKKGSGRNFRHNMTRNYKQIPNETPKENKISFADDFQEGAV